MLEGFIALGFILFCIYCIFMIIKMSKNKKRQSTKAMTDLKTNKSNNCNGCKNQESCKYGYYTYDSFDKRQWSLWEKFIRVAMENEPSNQTVQRPERINNLITKYTSQTVFTKSDEPWLKEYLAFEEAQLQTLKDFGKCGTAYIRYMRLGDSVQNIKETLNRLKTL